MNNHFTTTNIYRWIPVLAVAGVFSFPLTGGGELKKLFTPYAAAENAWTLVHATEVGEVDVDWTLAKNEGKEDETDWTLAKSDNIHEEEVDWTLA